LVAPVSSSGPNGDALTNVLQSACANAVTEKLNDAIVIDSAAAAISAVSLIGSCPKKPRLFAQLSGISSSHVEFL
jgi:hypothetical protein